MTDENNISGMKGLMAFFKRSRRTILEWIRSEGLPAAIIEGQWEADRRDLDTWRRDFIRKNQPKNGHS